MKKLSSLLFLAGTLLAGGTAQAQWTANAALNTTVRDQANVAEVIPLTAAAPNGGTYVSWFEKSAGTTYQLRLQLLDVNGLPQFGATGLLVSSQPQSSALYDYDLESDAAGNALVAFQDVRSGGTALQCVIYKVSPTGQQLWGATGIQLLDATTTQGLGPVIGFTGTGNVVVGWTGIATANGTHGTGLIPILKFSPAGTALWTTPVRIQAPSQTFSRPAFVAVPGTDEVVVQYVDDTNSSTVYAQRYNTSGTGVWTAPTQVSTKNISFVASPVPVADGSGGYFVQLNSGNPANANLNDAYVQRVAADGSLPWSTAGIELLAGTSSQRLGIGLDYVAARNELWVAMSERNPSGNQSGVTVQSLSSTTGAVQLGASGQVVKPISSDFYTAQSLRSTGTGLVVVYTQNISAVAKGLWANRLNYQGQSTLTAPVQLSSATSLKTNVSTRPFANNQLVTVWQDSRTGDGIYAQTINDSGQLGTPLATHPAAAPEALTLSNNPGATPVLHLSATRPQVAALAVRDLTGRLVWQGEAPLTTGPNTVPLATPALAAGLYLVQATVDGLAWRGRWVNP